MKTHLLQLIEQAASDEELLALLRAYVGSLPPRVVQLLPRDCVPHEVRDTEDVADWALRITQCRMGAGEGNAALDELEQVFARACVRVSQLLDRTGKWRYHVRPRDGDSDNQ